MRWPGPVSFPRSEEDEKNSKNVWFKGHKGTLHLLATALIPGCDCIHVDVTSVSILWSQPVSALQIMSPDGRWRWVKHMKNALVCVTPSLVDYRWLTSLIRH